MCIDIPCWNTVSFILVIVSLSPSLFLYYMIHLIVRHIYKYTSYLKLYYR